MVRVTGVPASKARRKKDLKRAKGFHARNKNTNRITSGVVRRAMRNEFVGRKRRKRDMRSLWITRIGIGARLNGTNYTNLMKGLKKANIAIDRKMLAELAVSNKEVFAHLVQLSTAAIAG